MPVHAGASQKKAPRHLTRVGSICYTWPHRCFLRLNREVGENPARSRRCNRGRKSENIHCLPHASGKGRTSRTIRKSEDLPVTKVSRVTAENLGTRKQGSLPEL